MRLTTLLAIASLQLACGTPAASTDVGSSPDASPSDSSSPGLDARVSPTDAAVDTRIDAHADPVDAFTPPRVDGGPLRADPCIAAGTCPPGTWIDVTPDGVTPSDYGPGPVVRDPARPSDLYFGGSSDGVWRSTDYGNTWSRIDEMVDGSPGHVPAVAQGLAIAVAGTTPATVWVAAGCACGRVYKSTDGGRSYRLTGSGLPTNADLYSIFVDPYDNNHLLSGLHEVDGIVESTDGGETWRLVGGTGFPSGGVSWYASFIDNGDAAATRRTWFAIAQNGGRPVLTTNSGATWTDPSGLPALQHPHGNSQVLQTGSELLVAGIGGIFRSTDYGASFTSLHDGNYGVIWGTSTSLYAAWGWACGRPCAAGPDMVTSPRPGNAWTSLPTPGIGTGPNSVVVTSDGTHTIFVATMWWAGIWRYIVP